MNVVPALKTLVATSGSVSDRLNQTCFCITLDREALCAALDREAGDPDFSEAAMKTRPHLFSNVPVFLSSSAVAAMGEVVAAIEAASMLPGYRVAAF
jgi:hypothetical protein